MGQHYSLAYVASENVTSALAGKVWVKCHTPQLDADLQIPALEMQVSPQQLSTGVY